MGWIVNYKCKCCDYIALNPCDGESSSGLPKLVIHASALGDLTGEVALRAWDNKCFVLNTDGPRGKRNGALVLSGIGSKIYDGCPCTNSSSSETIIIPPSHSSGGGGGPPRSTSSAAVQGFHAVPCDGQIGDPPDIWFAKSEWEEAGLSLESTTVQLSNFYCYTVPADDPHDVPHDALVIDPASIVSTYSGDDACTSCVFQWIHLTLCDDQPDDLGPTPNLQIKKSLVTEDQILPYIGRCWSVTASDEGQAYDPTYGVVPALPKKNPRIKSCFDCTHGRLLTLCNDPRQADNQQINADKFTKQFWVPKYLLPETDNFFKEQGFCVRCTRRPKSEDSSSSDDELIPRPSGYSQITPKDDYKTCRLCLCSERYRGKGVNILVCGTDAPTKYWIKENRLVDFPTIRHFKELVDGKVRCTYFDADNPIVDIADGGVVLTDAPDEEPDCDTCIANLPPSTSSGGDGDDDSSGGGGPGGPGGSNSSFDDGITSSGDQPPSSEEGPGSEEDSSEGGIIHSSYSSNAPAFRFDEYVACDGSTAVYIGRVPRFDSSILPSAPGTVLRLRITDGPPEGCYKATGNIITNLTPSEADGFFGIFADAGIAWDDVPGGCHDPLCLPSSSSSSSSISSNSSSSSSSDSSDSSSSKSSLSSQSSDSSSSGGASCGSDLPTSYSLTVTAGSVPCPCDGGSGTIHWPDATDFVTVDAPGDCTYFWEENAGTFAGGCSDAHLFIDFNETTKEWEIVLSADCDPTVSGGNRIVLATKSTGDSPAGTYSNGWVVT